MNWLKELMWGLAGSPLGWLMLVGLALGIVLWGPAVVDLLRPRPRGSRRR
jgi:hypothetical protein